MFFYVLYYYICIIESKRYLITLLKNLYCKELRLRALGVFALINIMAQKIIFLDDRGQTKSNDQLEIFANEDGLLTITMEDIGNDYSYSCIQLTKENALELVKHIQSELDLL